ncbi:unnamed protein product, partial [Caenorhabditis brenneri]
MKDILRNDKYALRTCVLYESMDARRLQLGPDLIHRFALSMYELFCKVIEDDAMEYREYEFWFYRFANGEVDLNFERDKDKKLYELTDMPIDIMRNIVRCLTIVDRLSLERTSQSLRLFSKDQKVFHRNLTFEADWKSANISFGRRACISYKNEGNDCVIEFRNRKKVLRGVSCLKQAFQDFKTILANPNFFLGTLIIWSSCEESKYLGRYIGDALKFTHLLRVEHIHLHAQSMKTLLNILPYLKPGYLTTITIDIDSDEAVIEKVVGMDQWKHAKYFHMRSNRFIGPLRHLYHFKEFDVRYNELAVEDVREMKEILLKSPDFEICNLLLYIANPLSYVLCFRMTEYLKNNPVALRHCLLYEYLQRNAYKRAFTNFRDTIGSDVFTEEELRAYFGQFKKRQMDGYSRPINDMKDVLRNDKHALRACILYESLKYKMFERGYKTCHLWPGSFLERPEILREPSFSLFNNFCKKLGDDVMEYREFDFWFYRFFNGEFDLNYEREKDEKTYELVDMPLGITRSIVEYLKIHDRMSVAQASRSFKTFVEDQKMFLRKIELSIDVRSARFSSENRYILTTKDSNGCRRCNERSGNDKLIQDVTYWKQGIQELMRILKFSELYLEEFNLDLFRFEESRVVWFKFFDEVVDALGVALKSIRQVHAQKLYFRAHSMKSLLNILPCLKPEYLSTIEFYVPADSFLFEELEKLEQWKQAKSFKMIHTLYVAPLFHLYHFKEFHVWLAELSAEDIRQMKEILFKSPVFEKCAIELRRSFDMEAIKNELGDAIEGNPNTFLRFRMTDCLKNNPVAVRHCLLYEYLQRNTYKRAFTNFRDTIGKNEKWMETIGNIFNDFWFCRFFNGEFDLNYERGKDKNIYELVDLPIDITRNVVEYLNVFDRMSLAQTSRSFKTFVEDQKAFNQKIKLLIDDDSARISSEDRYILTTKNSNGCRRCNERSGNDKLIQDVTYWKQGIQELMRILKFPELYLEEFNLDFFPNIESWGDRFKMHDEVIDALGVALKSIRQVHAKQLFLRARSLKSLLNILPCLKPEYLSTIEFYVPADSFLFEELEKLEQWKQAKCLKMTNTMYTRPLFHLSHFKEFEIWLAELSAEDIRQMKE